MCAQRDDEPRPFRWRNCRELSVAIWFSIMPWQWQIGVERSGDHTESRIGMQLGPVGLQIIATTGNCSAEGWRGRFGLGDEQAWERSK